MLVLEKKLSIDEFTNKLSKLINKKIKIKKTAITIGDPVRSFR